MVPPNNLGPNLAGKQASPKESHLIAVKRIFRYLKCTPSLGLWYPKCSIFDLKGYSDSDYAGCNMDKKAPQAPAKYLEANWFVGVLRNNNRWLCPQLRLNMLLLLGVVQTFYEWKVNSVTMTSITRVQNQVSVMNGKKPLTLDFKTFTESIGLDYNEDTYVSHPSPEVVKAELAKIATNEVLTKVDIEVLLGPEYTQDKKIRTLPGILSNSNFLKDPSKVTEIKLTASMIAVNNLETSVSPLPFSGKKKKGVRNTKVSVTSIDIIR
ncbi:hypothetical protein Tco_1196903 [Tanacetum coccineum]